MTESVEAALFTADDSKLIGVHLDNTVRDLIGTLIEQLRELLLVGESEDTRRLYPTAYPDDEELDADYRELVYDQLLMSRLDGIDVVENTLRNEELSIDEADVWMNTLNQLRLVLGTQLDVSEDDNLIDEDASDSARMVIYHVLSQILESLTDVRSRLL